LVTYNALAVLIFALGERERLSASPLAIFSCLFLGGLIAEQCGVGGNIQFYERYVLQAAPFIGAFSFTLLPTLDRGRMAAIGLLFLAGQLLLWHYV